MDGKCKVCKDDAICYKYDENDYGFMCYNENCDFHFPESQSNSIEEIPEWFRWKTFSDRIYDKKFKILFLCGIFYLFIFILHQVCNKNESY